MRAVEVFQNRLGRTGTMRSILPLGKSTTHCHMIFFFSWKYDRLWIIHMCNYTLWKTSSRELDACLTVYSSMHLNLNSDELHFFFGFFCILPHFFCVAANTAVNQLCPLMTSELTVHGLKHSLVKSTCPWVNDKQQRRIWKPWSSGWCLVDASLVQERGSSQSDRLNLN